MYMKCIWNVEEQLLFSLTIKLLIISSFNCIIVYSENGEQIHSRFALILFLVLTYIQKVFH